MTFMELNSLITMVEMHVQRRFHCFKMEKKSMFSWYKKTFLRMSENIKSRE